MKLYSNFKNSVVLITLIAFDIADKPELQNIIEIPISEILTCGKRVYFVNKTYLQFRRSFVSAVINCQSSFEFVFTLIFG